MTLIQFRQLGGEALLSTAPIPADEARAVATAPGGCSGSRYPLFVLLDAEAVTNPLFAEGSFVMVEFLLPGKPGRWRATGEVQMVVAKPRPDAPLGLGLELVGLMLTSDVPPGGLIGGDEEPAGPPFDPTRLTFEKEEVAGMLSDLLGRDVTGEAGCSLSEGVAAETIVAVFRDDAGRATFAIVLDKAGAARIGGALTLVESDEVNAAVEAPGALGGELLGNAGEVLNIMSALFHDSGAPHVTLAETLQGAESSASTDTDLAKLLAEPRWKLALQVQIDAYGSGEVLLLAR